MISSRLAPPTPDGLRRFEQAVCPLVVGLNPTQASLIEQRMRKVAGAVDVPVSAGKCTPNLILAVTDDKARFLKELLRTKPAYFGEIQSGDMRTIFRERGSAAAWQTNGWPLNARGQPLFEDPTLGVYVNRTSEAASRLQEPARKQFETAVVVVERRALDGLTTTQLADYAALRGLTAADPQRLAGSGAPSILTALDAPANAQVPLSMTDWDFSFLRGYYQTHRGWSTASQQSEIQRTVGAQVGAQRSR